MTRKEAIRQQIKLLKREIGDTERKLQAEKAAKRLEANAHVRSAGGILLYAALPDEIDTREMLDKWAATKRVYLPVVAGDTLLIGRYTGKSALRPGAFHIPEPTVEQVPLSAIDVAVIPGVAFDRRGNRLGRGKGFYDRFLSQPGAKHIYKIGLCYDFQLLDALPAEEHDIVMHEIITG